MRIRMRIVNRIADADAVADTDCGCGCGSSMNRPLLSKIAGFNR